MHEELELRLRCADDLESSVVLDWLGDEGELSDEGQSRRLDLYLDTIDGCLQAAGLSARQRTEPGRVTRIEVEPVPLLPSVVMRRAELGVEVEPSEDVPAALRGLLLDELGLAIPDTLRGIVELDVQRHRWRLRGPSYEGELSLDRVRARRPEVSGTHHFCELELELVEGEVGAFEAVARRLADALAKGGRAWPSGRSTYLHAREALALPAFFEVEPELRLDPRDRLGAVARRVGRRLLAKLERHEPGTRVGLDPEQLHKMRVATRRLWAMLRIFGPAFERPTRRALRSELAWLADRLGAVRDLDVQRLALPGWRRRFSGEASRAGWDGVEAMLEARWQTARAELLAALDDERYRRLCMLAGDVFSPEPSPSTRAGRHRLENALPRLMRRPLRRFERAHERFQEQQQVADAHRLRIEAKGLRYATEVVAPLLRGGGVRKRLERLTRFQDVLGELQDAVVAQSLATDLLAEATAGEEPIDPSLAFALGQLAGGCAAELDRAPVVVHQAIERLDARGLLERLNEAIARVSRR